MEGIYHSIIIAFGMLGLLLGGVLIDLDHKGMTWQCKWTNFWKSTPCGGPITRGIFHNPTVMLSIISFSLCLGFGVLLHMCLDFNMWK